jgi:hypothetical protein
MSSESPRSTPLLLFILAWVILGFGFVTIGGRLWVKVDGVIVSSRDIPGTGRPRYSTEYMILGADGEKQQYTAGATDASLPRSLPVGTHLRGCFEKG